MGGSDGEGIRFHAAMYRSEAHSLEAFISAVRRGKRMQSYFDMGPVPDGLTGPLGVDGRVVIPSDTVRHVDRRHPAQGDGAWGRVMETLETPDRMFEGNAARSSKGRSLIVVKRYGDMAHAVIVEAVPNSKRGLAYVTTNFEGTVKGVEDWAARQEKGEEVRMGAGGDSSTSPGPEGQSHVNTSSIKNIHHPGELRKVLERLQRRAKNAAPLKVVNSFDDLPERVRGHAAARGVDGVNAVHDGRTTYVVADQVGSVDQAVALWAHEQGIHHGLRGLVGDDERFNGLMDGLYEHFGAERLEDVRQAYGLDFSNVAHRRVRPPDTSCKAAA